MDIQKFLGDENEKPLDRITGDGGFCSIFRTIGCVGDSLSSGEFESVDESGKKHYNDMFEYSWGQFIARMTGSRVYNFSRGGMTAKEYCESFAQDKDFWNPDLACRAYILALGVNDVLNQNMTLGSTDDICREDWSKNQPTFSGWFGQIVQRLKAIQPDAKFFFVTCPPSGGDAQKELRADAHAALMYRFAEFFDNSYVIDLRKYGPTYDAAFREQFYLGGHMNACGYALTAKLIASYIDYIIRHNMKDFAQIAFVGTPLTYREV